jgi:hypothetical protein
MRCVAILFLNSSVIVKRAGSLNVECFLARLPVWMRCVVGTVVNHTGSTTRDVTTELKLTRRIFRSTLWGGGGARRGKNVFAALKMLLKRSNDCFTRLCHHIWSR